MKISLWRRRTLMSDAKANEKKQSRKVSVVDIVFASILVLFPFIHVNTGIDVADVGYNLLNFTTFPNMNRTWAVSTLLANLVGKFFTFLPLGKCMVGMNIYCMLLCGAFTLLFYWFLRKYYSNITVFLGLLTAIGFCWCPRVILYHYLTYFLFGLGTILLLTAIKKQKCGFYIAAGAVLALNTFVRFPNIVECLLIVVLFAYGIMAKKHIIKEFLWCIAGYLGTFALGVLLISIFFGKTAYPDMISSLFGMTSEATSYTPKSMLVTIFGDYLNYYKPMLAFLGIAVLGAVPLALINSKIGKMITVLIMGLLFGGVMRVLYYYGIMNFNFIDYRSIYMWGTLTFVIAMALAISGLFVKGRGMERRLLGIAVVCIILITPIGSNNGLYTPLNNMFLVAPYVIGELSYDLMADLFLSKRDEKKKIWWGILSFRAVGLMVSTMTLVCGILFGVVFVFRDDSFLSTDYRMVTGMAPLDGTRTNYAHATELEMFYEYLHKNDLLGKSTICYGFIPGLMYIYEQTPALSHSWPGLDSFPKEELKADLDSLLANGEKPVFFYAASFEDLTSGDIDAMENEKQKMFAGFLQSSGYEEVLRGDFYVLCLPKKEE